MMKSTSTTSGHARAATPCKRLATSFIRPLAKHIGQKASGTVRASTRLRVHGRCRRIDQPRLLHHQVLHREKGAPLKLVVQWYTRITVAAYRVFVRGDLRTAWMCLSGVDVQVILA